MGFNARSEPKYTIQQSVNLNVADAGQVMGAAPADVRTPRRLNRVCIWECYDLHYLFYKLRVLLYSAQVIFSVFMLPLCV